MRRGRLFFVILLSVTGLCGCNINKSPRDGVISEQLPVTVDDLAEVRDGRRNHEKVLWEYRLYRNEKLNGYCNQILSDLAKVSERPNLPYQVYLLDSDEINVFGGPGGHVYITRGFFNFIQSEAELAAAIAHEVTHVASYQYASVPQQTRIQQAYNIALQGSEFAKSAIGSYGTAVNMGLKGVGKAAPAIARRFGKDEEIATDDKAIQVMLAAGYDPHGYLRLVDRLTRVEMSRLEDFAVYMSAHPPFAERRELLINQIKEMHLDTAKVTIKQDRMISEVQVVEAPVITAAPAAVKKDDSILFKPNLSADPAGSASLGAK